MHVNCIPQAHTLLLLYDIMSIIYHGRKGPSNCLSSSSYCYYSYHFMHVPLSLITFVMFVQCLQWKIRRVPYVLYANVIPSSLKHTYIYSLLSHWEAGDVDSSSIIASWSHVSLRCSQVEGLEYLFICVDSMQILNYSPMFSYVQDAGNMCRMRPLGNQTQLELLPSRTTILPIVNSDAKFDMR